MIHIEGKARRRAVSIRETELAVGSGTGVNFVRTAEFECSTRLRVHLATKSGGEGNFVAVFVEESKLVGTQFVLYSERGSASSFT